MEVSHLEIFNRPQAIVNSRQHLLPRTDILQIRWVPLITGRLMEDGCLIGGHLMEVQLYTEWDDNHVCIINQ